MGCCYSKEGPPLYNQLTLDETSVILHDRFIHCIICKNLITTTRDTITGCGKCHYVLGHLSCLNHYATCPKCGK